MRKDLVLEMLDSQDITRKFRNEMDQYKNLFQIGLKTTKSVLYCGHHKALISVRWPGNLKNGPMSYRPALLQIVHFNKQFTRGTFPSSPKVSVASIFF